MNKTLILLGILFIIAPVYSTCPAFAGIACPSCRRIANCTSCQTSDYTDPVLLTPISVEICTACANDLFPNALSTACVSCSQATGDSFCETCTPPKIETPINLRTTCNTCVSGYGVNSMGKCTQCKTPSCTQCSFDAQDVETCTGCPSGQFFDAAKKVCSACSAHCTVCNSATECTACSQPGFYVAAGACAACTAPCTSCSGDATTCTACDTAAGKVKVLSSCYSKIDHCVDGEYAVVNSVLNCNTCDAGYYLNADKTQCLAVTPVTQCLEYKLNTNECGKCNPNYFLGTPPTTCTKCIDNCNVCASVTTCTDNGCKDRYFYDTTTDPAKPACSPCIKNCATCTTTTTCATCDATFYTDTCIECKVANCAVGYCSTTDAATCNQCAQGFGKSANECIQCDDTNCKVCSADKATCTTCNPGFWPSSGKCVANSIPDCTQQTADKTCSSCNDGFLLSFANDACVSCGNAIPGCTECSWSTNYDNNNLMCKTCISGYTLVNQVCVPCPSGCSSCTLKTVSASGNLLLADAELIQATTGANYFASLTQALSCDSCLSGFSSVSNSANAVYCAKSSSSYLLFVFAQLVLAVVLLF